LEPDPDSRELVLTGVHPGIEVEQVEEATGWRLKVAENVTVTPEPTEEELSVVRSLTRT
jgi:glutaconate CoA-transferase subunit B